MPEQSSQWWVSLLQILLSWQVVIMILFFSVRKWIISLFTKDRLKIKAGDFEVDFSKTAQDQTISSSEEKSILEKAIKLFSDETLTEFKNYVENESKFSTLPTDRAKIDRLLDYSITLYIIYRFQLIYDTIFGSQISLLQYLNFSGTVSNQVLQQYYDQAKAKYPQIYQDYSLKSWHEFLILNRLITDTKTDSVAITFFGVDFLKYLVDTRKNIYKPY